MNGLCAALMLLACGGLLAGEDLPEPRLAECDAVVRDGLAFRCRVSVPDGPGDDRTTLRLSVALDQDGVALANAVLPGVTRAQLRMGIPVTLFPDLSAVAHPLVEAHLRIAVAGESGQPRSVERALPTPRQLQARLEALATRLQDHPAADDALPWLWLEEADERMQGAPSLATCSALAGLQPALAGWLDGNRQTVA
ncbi:MAG: hypothetical protein H0X38_13760, partial [Planctomycetes bacterium]|nr:hypothetical protein [Planctomycetota bacterium]